MSKRLFIILSLSVLLCTGCKKQDETVDKEKLDLSVKERNSSELTDQAQDELSYGGTVYYHTNADASNLNPVTNIEFYSATIFKFLFNSLVKFDQEGKLVADLAERWKVSDNGKEVIFFLRDNVRWHDGVGFTAEDVKFTYEKIIDPFSMSRKNYCFSMIEQLEIIDPYTVRVYYKKPYAYNVRIWDVIIVPAHLYGAKQHDFNRCPVGTGPYCFVEWLQHEKLILEANSDYFGGRPCIDNFVFRCIPDSSVAFQSLKNGEFDLMFLNSDQYHKQTNDPEFKKRFTSHTYVNFIEVLGYNAKLAMFSDKRVRQALTHAIDRQRIVAEVHHGFANVVSRIFTHPETGYGDVLEPLAYNPDRSRKLLKECGWEDTDGDGIIDRNGKPFKFSFVAVYGTTNRHLAAEIVVKNLRNVGIIVEPRFLELSQFMDSLLNGDFDAIWTRLDNNDDPYLYFHSSQSNEPKKGRTGLNLLSTACKEMDLILEKARETLDTSGRRKILNEFHKVFQDYHPVTIMYLSNTILTVNNKLKGVQVNNRGIGNIPRWYVVD